MKIGLIISITINIVLMFLVFVKPALNEIVVDVWKTWKKNKEKKKENLKKLRSLLMDYSAALVTTCIQGMGYMSVVRNQAELAMYKPDFDKSKDAYTTANKALADLRLEIPKSYQERVASILKEGATCVTFALAKASGNMSITIGFENWTMKDFINCLISTQKLCTDFCSDIEKELKRAIE